MFFLFLFSFVFFFQAEDGIRDLVRSRGLGYVYKRQGAGGEADAEILVLGADLLHRGACLRQRAIDGLLLLSLIHI